MQRLLTELVDVLFPPTVGEKLLRTVKTETLQSLYEPGQFQNTQYLCSYHHPIVQTAVIENKFHHQRVAANVLGKTLDLWIKEQTEELVFVPIPLAPKRQRERGHNQVETIIRFTDKKTPLVINLLKRRIETAPQSHLKKHERLHNIQNAFAYTGKTPDWPAGTRVVLFDDVVTTGATMRAARATLAPHLPPHTILTCLAIAH